MFCIASYFPNLQYTLLLCINYKTQYNILHQCRIRWWNNMWYVPIIFHMFSCGKRSYSAALKVSDAVFGLWHMVTACYCRYMRPLQFLLEDTSVFSWVHQKQKKIPLQAKIRLPIQKTLYHNQLYTTYISHLITMNISQSTLSFQLDTRSVCFPMHTPLHTHSSFCAKPQIQTKKQKKMEKGVSVDRLSKPSYLSVLLVNLFYKWRTLGASSEHYVHWLCFMRPWWCSHLATTSLSSVAPLNQHIPVMIVFHLFSS